MNVGQVSEAYGAYVLDVCRAVKSGELHGTLSTIQEACAEAWHRGEQCSHYASEATASR